MFTVLDPSGPVRLLDDGGKSGFDCRSLSEIPSLFSTSTFHMLRRWCDVSGTYRYVAMIRRESTHDTILWGKTLQDGAKALRSMVGLAIPVVEIRAIVAE